MDFITLSETGYLFLWFWVNSLKQSIKNRNSFLKNTGLAVSQSRIYHSLPKRARTSGEAQGGKPRHQKTREKRDCISFRQRFLNQALSPCDRPTDWRACLNTESRSGVLYPESRAISSWIPEPRGLFSSFPESRTLGKCFLNVWQFLAILVYY